MTDTKLKPDACGIRPAGSHVVNISNAETDQGLNYVILNVSGHTYVSTIVKQ